MVTLPQKIGIVMFLGAIALSFLLGYGIAIYTMMTQNLLLGVVLFITVLFFNGATLIYFGREGD